MPGRVLQFGTSRFLQGHADLLIHQAMQQGQNIGPITVVKTTQGGARDGRVAALNSGEGFPVRIRGLENGTPVDETVTVKSVTAAIDANLQWQELERVFVQKTDIVISNVGDGGYQIEAEDQNAPSLNHVPASFPAKLLVLLKRRFEQNAAPLLILPCELLSNNGAALRQILTELSSHWHLPKPFLDWLTSEVTICNTLVDRIVSEAIEPIGAVAEPYGLWAIEWDGTVAIPFRHEKIIYTENLEPFLRLKLHILNLGHSFLAELWKSEMRPAQETVVEILRDAAIKARLMRLYESEVIPGFGARNLGDDARDYVNATLQRFENPYLQHRISDIHQNHAVKIARRMQDFIKWALQADAGLAFPQLREICEKNGAR